MTKQINKRPPPEEWLAVASMAVLLLITLVNVLIRYFSNESVAWTEEISVFLMVVLTLAGASSVASRDRHVRIEYFLNRPIAGGSYAPRRGLLLFGALLTSIVFTILAALFGCWVYDQYRFSETSVGLGIPLWWYGIAIPPLCLAISARAFAVFRRLLRSSKQDGA